MICRSATGVGLLVVTIWRALHVL